MYNDFRHKKFLVVDDFAEFRKSLRFMLQTFGASFIDEAGSAVSAISQIEIKPYDIILCDYNLGNNFKDGQQVFEEIRHRNLIKFSTVFIMITAENTQSMIMGVVEYHPDDYLVKPFTKEMLKTRIDRALKKKNDFEGIESAVRNGAYHYAIELCEQQIQSNPQNRFEYLKVQGELLLQTGEYASARSLYEKVLAEREIPWAKIGLGKACFHEEDYINAGEIFSSVIANNRMIIEAYDWLARTLMKSGEIDKAQAVLQTAVGISPKSAVRQNMLGDVSFQNNDFDVSENAFRASISHGRNSCLKSPSSYTGLVRSLISKDQNEATLPVLQDIKSEFKGSINANFQAAALKSMVLKKLNRDDDALKAAREASELFSMTEECPPDDIVLDLAKTCIELGDKEKGLSYIQELVKNNHDDTSILQKAQNVFHDLGMEEEGIRLISLTKKEVIQINNDGVRLVEEGKLDEAIASFEKAVSSMPGNKIIAANTAQAILMFVQRNGRNEGMLIKAKNHLDRLRKLDSGYQKIPRLTDMYERLVAL
jgi:FimV-like protein